MSEQTRPLTDRERAALLNDLAMSRKNLAEWNRLVKRLFDEMGERCGDDPSDAEKFSYFKRLQIRFNSARYWRDETLAMIRRDEAELGIGGQEGDRHARVG